MQLGRRGVYTDTLTYCKPACICRLPQELIILSGISEYICGVVGHYVGALALQLQKIQAAIKTCWHGKYVPMVVVPSGSSGVRRTAGALCQ